MTYFYLVGNFETTIDMSSSSDESSILYAPELAQMMLDPITLNRLADDFSPDRASTALLRYFGFISHRIAELEEDLNYHRGEREEIFNFATENAEFRRTLRPIV